MNLIPEEKENRLGTQRSCSTSPTIPLHIFCLSLPLFLSKLGPIQWVFSQKDFDLFKCIDLNFFCRFKSFILNLNFYIFSPQSFQRFGVWTINSWSSIRAHGSLRLGIPNQLGVTSDKANVDLFYY